MKVLVLVDHLFASRLRANVIALGSAIGACQERWPEALQLLRMLQELRIQANAICYNSAISALEKGGEWLRALRLLREMQETRLQLDIVSISSAISACEKGGQWQEALQLLRELRHRAVKANVVACSAAISACEKGQEWQRALQLLFSLGDWHVQPNIFSFSAAVVACERGRAWREALQLLRAMDEALDVPSPEVMTYNAAISACEKQGQWRHSLALLGVLEEARLADVISYNASISACEKAKRWQEALQVLVRLRQSRMKEDMISYSSAILACDSSGEWHQALALLEDVQQRRMQVNVITYSSAINACEKRGKWQQALSLLGQLQGCCSALQWANAATGKVARKALLDQLRAQESAVSSSASRLRPVSRSLAVGLRLAGCWARGSSLLPLTLCLAPGLLELLWQGHGDSSHMPEAESNGHAEAATNGSKEQNGNAKHHKDKDAAQLVPLGVAERVGSWLAWYRSIAGYLTVAELEMLPYICLLLVDGAATGLENLAHTLRPLGILGAAAWLCHRAPRWAVLIWAHAGRKRAMARGADGFAWVFWLGFPGFADSWSSSLWHAWQGESRRGFWKALNGIQEELQRKGKDSEELVRCHHCWFWVPESSSTTWRRKIYCEDCTEGWEQYKQRRCEQLGVDTVSPAPRIETGMGKSENG
ncbi:unnamed protein product [Effrenium voratum]|uniref:Pentatricopeptide repeat-containing protein-mitochondrial domain-containing protein n=1 Tax=Effrenium voratum TaxID=2562239 RepID=A0AA36I463_9DINO|nr:unnamed protein product [Effrenium voratum]